MINSQGDPPILTGVNWKKVGPIVIRELSNREKYAPVISVYRWWARRPHELIGAILDAAVKLKNRTLAVSDPFSGGGTVTFEARVFGPKWLIFGKM